MTMGIIAVCALAGTYLYVMGLCYICDLYERNKQKKHQKLEKKRKEELKLTAEQAEVKRKRDLEGRRERRRKMEEARRQMGFNGGQSRPAQVARS
jgi:hypothetical protein